MMREAIGDRTTVSINIWSIFTDAIMAVTLLLIFFIFVQVIASSEIFVKMQIRQAQDKMERQVKIALKDKQKYLEVIIDGNLQRFRFSDAILFDEAEAVLQPLGMEVLAALGGVLRSSDNLYDEILIEGHTDDKAISTYRFPSNWELSSARATAVVRFLEDRARLDPKRFRLSSVGRSEYVPTDPAYDPERLSRDELIEQRAANRRIEIVLVYSESKYSSEEPGETGE